MLMTGWIRIGRTTDKKDSTKKLNNKLKRTVQVRTWKMKRKKKYVQCTDFQN
jgi:hypothetical protein